MCQKEVPDVLYRYHKPTDWKYLFEERTMRFTPLAEFNDPFEGKPATNLIYTKPENVFKGYNEFTHRLLKKGKLAFAPAQGITDTLINQAVFFLEAKYVLKENEAKMRKGFHDKLTARYGALCLTNNKNNILMWSHYAESHKGFVIEFDVKDLISKINDNIYIDLSRISYEKKRPCLVMDDLIEQEESIACFTKSVLTKSKLWEYEQEWRSLILFIGRDKQKINPVQPLAPSSIKSVIFGMSMAQEEIRRKCRSLRKLSEYDHVSFKKAVMDDKEYAVVIENIDNNFI